MPGYRNTTWKKIPFLKLFLSLSAGILLQWYAQPPTQYWWWMIAFFLPVQVSIFFIPFFERFKLGFLTGLTTIFLFSALGGLIVSKKDIRNHKAWLGKLYSDQDIIAVTADEPPVEKPKTIKLTTSARFLSRNGSTHPVKGKIILYFRKQDAGGLPDTSLLRLTPGVEIIFKKPLQEIINNGNPGGFDYKQYSLFRDITHQVYLKKGEYMVRPETKKEWFRRFIYSAREKVLAILRTYIPGDKQLGLAEALLIGYKHDLDPELVQSYTNTGVVHIIAISGLHIGLVYWLLVQLLKPLRKNKTTRRLIPFFIITGLWVFSFLAGAQPSILRSALMFTCIVIGENLSRKTSIYNTLAVSAFLLLCINPFWLWDAGFQLSYAAVLSIVIFMRPIYNWFYIENKILDHIWKLNAVTLAAQVFTVPLCLYHFHQFPNYFMLSNFLAVPLSSLVLIGEIILCSISFLPFAAILVGKIISWLIALMNSYVVYIESLPFSLSDGLMVSLPQVILLFLFAATTGYWLTGRSTNSLKVALLSFLGFTVIRSISVSKAGNQKKLVVYNIPKKTAIDLVNGRDYMFIGDSDLLHNNPLHTFHLKPSRTRFRTSAVDSMNDLYADKNYFHYHGLHILWLDTTIHFTNRDKKTVIDILILSRNPAIYITRLARSLEIRQVVIDGSVPSWKSRYWKKDCDSLNISCHDVTEKGAFVMNLR